MPTIKCDWCEEEFYKKPSRIERSERDFCSLDCRNKWVSKNHNKMNSDVLKCPVCGEKFDSHFARNGHMVKHSEKHKKAMKKRDISGENGPFYGKEHSEKVKEKLSRLASKRTGKDNPFYGCEHSDETKKELSEFRKGKTWEEVMGEETARKAKKKRASHVKGEKNMNWKEGTCPGYYGPNWREQRRKALKRDNHTCQKCGKSKKELGIEPSVHHKVPFRNFGVENYAEANKLSNLISLCRSCHDKIESWPVIPTTSNN